ncbi:T20D4.11-like domain-containing protein [Caenorhabditis elegans]|uniref:T20D4.11-like domain-containing protein n=1 Tax=Caenorhabditis elegans TaxID=6239 RepID=F1LIM2_CAEEL|nr:DUF19 domain-containing protein [Caenorhabditis elegans]CCD64075.1 DUF19 domain-containing protein [Caenorhabditis elegans]|eukprot:NP_001256096.1 Uncharacterized protein CELE_ZC513.14 [Caenorhabditis elegans]
MFVILLFLFAPVVFSNNLEKVAPKNAICDAKEFFKVFGCIQGLSELISSVDNYNLKLVEDRENFTSSCNVVLECFSTDCLNAHNLKLFLEAFCGYSTFLETGFQKCKEKMDARSETQCEKSFKAFFENNMTTEMKCDLMNNSLECIKSEVTKVCGKDDATNISQYLAKMNQGLSCDNDKMKKSDNITKTIS